MADSPESPSTSPRIPIPPGRLALVLAIGPSIVWCAEYIGSGEVILATRTGAILGTGVIWAVVLGIFLKYVIGLAGGWYTVATGESMMDMLGRLPGRYVVLWLVLVLQLVASVVSIGGIAASAGKFLEALLPVEAYYAGWAVTLFAVVVAWVGEFKPLKIIMSILVAVVVLGVAVIALRVLPPLSAIVSGMIPQVPKVPEWAQDIEKTTSAWSEILPLLGWGAGGFASQVWYTYWIMGAGYGAAAGRRQGQPADLEALRKLDTDDALRIKDWRRVITFDASVALLIGVFVTLGFLIAGAQVLGTRQLAPADADVAITLAQIFGESWGQAGATLFLMGGAAALISTQLAQVAGWPYLVDDAVRLCLPGLASRWSTLTRRRAWLVFYLIMSMTIVYQLGYRPVGLVKLAAVAEGLLLTPLQAIAVLLGLYWILPKLYQPEVGRLLRPSPVIGIGLLASAAFFSYFCVIQLLQ